MGLALRSYLDSLVLVAQSSFRLYIFFNRPFNIPVVSRHVNSHRPYANLPLHLAHSPHFLKPIPSASSMKTDPFEGRSSHSILHVVESGSFFTDTDVLPEMQSKEYPGELVLENGFHTS